MTALSAMRLVPEPAGRITNGIVRLDGEDLLQLPEGYGQKEQLWPMILFLQQCALAPGGTY